MATRNSSGVERRRVPLDANRPRTHPKHTGRKATKVRPPSAEGDECPKHGDVLDRPSRALTGWPTTDAHIDGQEMRIGGEL
jgi:hypothetical protein